MIWSGCTCNPTLAHPLRDRLAHPLGLLLADAVHHHVIDVGFERDGYCRTIDASNA